MFNAEAVRARIEEVAKSEAELAAAVAWDVAFHMTDWLEDLAAYVAFCRNPTQPTSAQVNKLLIDFLVHVPNHLAAASKLFAEMPVTDVFGVGAVEHNEKGAG